MTKVENESLHAKELLSYRIKKKNKKGNPRKRFKI